MYLKVLKSFPCKEPYLYSTKIRVKYLYKGMFYVVLYMLGLIYYKNL